MKRTRLAIAIGVICTLTLTGCGGGGGSDSSTTTYQATAIDGFLRNALVWLDLDGDFILDEGEPSAQSGEGGIAQLDVTDIDDPSLYSVVVRAISGQTIDEDTITDSLPQGSTVTTSYVMSAPAGETAVTPLSTLVNISLKKLVADSGNSSPTAEEYATLQQQAVSNIAAQLGLDSSSVLGNYLENGDDDVAYAAQNVVGANILPQTEEDTATLIDEMTDGSDSNDGFINLLDATTAVIKTQIASVTDGNFADTDSVFDGSDDGTVDTDGDGVPDFIDGFPNDSTEWADTDDDGIGNNADTDDDGDGVSDSSDAFPLNANESVDTDQDGLGNNADTDDDGDGVADSADAFPLDNTETIDTDNDSIGNNADTDDDGDGVADSADTFPLDNTETIDTDNDGIGNNADTDDDGDGVADVDDAFPLDATETTDSDGDGIGDNADTDSGTGSGSSAAVWNESNWNESNWQ